jgi:ribonuclease P/MRP protein subunit RPP1
MIYDLNVPWTPSTPLATLSRTISFLSSLNYATLALTYTLNASSLPSQITNPIPLDVPTPPTTTLLRRCTLILSDPAQNPRLTALAQAFDILAIRPTTEKAYLSACLTMNDISIISLDMTQKYQFYFKPKPLMAAVTRGVRIEINYAQATLGDSAARRNFISNAMAIIRATRGRGLVISSEAQDVLGVRAPADVVNLLSVWGLGRERGVESMSGNPRGVVVNEAIKRRGYRGVIDVVYGGEKPTPTVKEKGNGNGNGEGKKGKGKRKVDEVTTPTSTPSVSKRQAKKQRIEALKTTQGFSAPSTPKDTPPDTADSTPKSNGNG